MSDSSDQDNKDAAKLLVEQAMDEAMREYLKGAINEDDGGVLVCAMAVDSSTNRLLVRFPRPVSWFGMDLEDLDSFITLLQKKRVEMVEGE